VLIPTATTSQQFAVVGASHLTTGDAPRLDAGDQLQVRYVASSNSYEIQMPGSQTWSALTGKSEVEATGGGLTMVIENSAYQYSSLIEWWNDLRSVRGVDAIGIATPAGAVPVTGSATYSAWATGRTSEVGDIHDLVDPLVQGSMVLNFDFAQGTLAGSMTAVLDPEWYQYQLGTLNFRDTIFSKGSTTFSGKFDTDLTGLNSFNGFFTGPRAQELIGNFAFPYQSPIDGKTYQAGGAFIGAK
jgi:hypothetical protein